MKKRIGTKIYDTETSECCKVTENGRLFRKRTRDKEYFFAYSNGDIVPLTDEDIRDLEANLVTAQLGDLFASQKATGSSGYQVRVDKQTHDKLRKASKEQGVTISTVVKELVADHL